MQRRYADRIELCKLFIDVTLGFYGEGFIRQELETVKDALEDFIRDNELESEGEEQLECETQSMIYTTMDVAYKYLARACNADGKDNCHTEMTRSQAAELFIKIQQEQEEMGQFDLFNTNINEWVEKMGISIVDDADEMSKSE